MMMSSFPHSTLRFHSNLTHSVNSGSNSRLICPVDDSTQLFPIVRRCWRPSRISAIVDAFLWRHGVSCCQMVCLSIRSCVPLMTEKFDSQETKWPSAVVMMLQFRRIIRAIGDVGKIPFKWSLKSFFKNTYIRGGFSCDNCRDKLKNEEHFIFEFGLFKFKRSCIQRYTHNF